MCGSHTHGPTEGTTNVNTIGQSNIPGQHATMLTQSTENIKDSTQSILMAVPNSEHEYISTYLSADQNAKYTSSTPEGKYTIIAEGITKKYTPLISSAGTNLVNANTYINQMSEQLKAFHKIIFRA